MQCRRFKKLHLTRYLFVQVVLIGRSRGAEQLRFLGSFVELGCLEQTSTHALSRRFFDGAHRMLFRWKVCYGVHVLRYLFSFVQVSTDFSHFLITCQRARSLNPRSTARNAGNTALAISLRGLDADH